MLNSLESYNVKVGAFKSKIDTNLVESELLKEYEDLSWVSINIFGTKANEEAFLFSIQSNRSFSSL